MQLTTLITGATRFIGRKLTKVVDGEIRVLSRAKHSEYDTIICDFQSEDIPAKALNNVDTVLHLAGFAHDMSDVSIVKHLYQKINVDETVQLAELAVRSGVRRFVFVSSVKAG